MFLNDLFNNLGQKSVLKKAVLDVTLQANRICVREEQNMPELAALIDSFLDWLAKYFKTHVKKDKDAILDAVVYDLCYIDNNLNANIHTYFETDEDEDIYTSIREVIPT